MSIIYELLILIFSSKFCSSFSVKVFIEFIESLFEFSFLICNNFLSSDISFSLSAKFISLLIGKTFDISFE